MTELKAIDAWINPNFASDVPPDRDVDYLFKGFRERKARGTTLEQLLEEMDAANVERAVLCAGYGDIDDTDWVIKVLERYPHRFIGSVVVDPREGMESVRFVERLAADHDFKMVRFLGFETQLPYDHAAYYPVYAKCVELGLIVGCNVGIPGPRVPGRHQHPISLDEVCYFFPELKVVMQHGGEPWSELCVKLMLKWPNLHYMSSAFAPRHIPQAIVKYMNTRGADKVMFASDYPLLPLDRCVAEIAEMPFRDEERRHKFAYVNAERLFLG